MFICKARRQNIIMCCRMLYSRASYMVGAFDSLSVRLESMEHK